LLKNIFESESIYLKSAEWVSLLKEKCSQPLNKCIESPKEGFEKCQYLWKMSKNGENGIRKGL